MPPSTPGDGGPLSLLARASEQLAASLDYPTTLREVTRLVVPQLAEACIVDLLDGDELRQVAAAHADPGQEELLTRLGRDFPLGAGQIAAVSRVLRTGRPIQWSTEDTELLDSFHPDPEHRRLVARLGFRSGMLVPLIAHGSVIGALSLNNTTPDSYAADDLVWAVDLGRRCGLAIDNARLAQERDVALALAELERGQLRELFHQVPAIVAVYRGPDFVIEFANERFLELAAGRDLVGRPAAEAFPELVDQPDWELLQEVYRTGEPLVAEERYIQVTRPDGRVEDRWLHYIAQPIRGPEGDVTGLLIHSVDVTAQVLARRRAEALTERLQRLASAALAFTAARDVGEMLRIVTAEALAVVGAHLACTTLPGQHGWDDSIAECAVSDKYAAWREPGVRFDVSGTYAVVGETGQVQRLTQAQLEAHPGGHVLGAEPGRLPPLRGLLAVPIRQPGSGTFGILMVSDKLDGDFDDDDEAVLVQLAQMASVVLRNARLFEEVEASYARLDTFLSAAPIGVAMLDADLRYVQVNRMLAAMYGAAAGDIVGRTPTDVIPSMAPIVESLMRQVITTGEPIVNREITAVLPDRPGQQRNLVVSYFPVPAGAGVGGVGAVVSDVTERRRAEARLRFLSDASRALAGSLDFDDTMSVLARESLPQLGDYVLVDVIEEDATVRRVAAESASATDADLLALLRGHVPDLEGPEGVARVLRTGESILFPENAEPFALDANAEAGEGGPRPAALRLPVASAMVVPMTARGRVVGAISFGVGEPARRYTEADLALAEELGRRAGLAVDNSRLFRAEQQARTEAEEVAAQLNNLMTVVDTALSHMALDDLMSEILIRIGEILEVDVQAVFIVSDDGQSLVVQAARNVENALDVSIPLGYGVSGRAAAERRVIRIESLTGTHDIHRLLYEQGIRAGMSAPLVLGGDLLGVLFVGNLHPRRFSDDEATLLQLAADRTALAIEHGRRFQQEHSVAETLQRSLLPQRLPDIPGVEVAVRYIAGAAGTAVGGDWYDVLALPGGRVGLVIGDVVGRGVRAASIMGQLRNVLRAYALEGHPPAEVLGRLDQLVEQVSPTLMATIVYAVFDPASGSLRFASAGHPPLLVVGPEGLRFLEGGRSVPIGAMPGTHFVEANDCVPPGSRLVLYTDGLVEERGVPIDEGLDRLARAVAEGPTDLEALCDHILTSVLLRDQPGDDVALLVLRPIELAGGPLHFDLPADPVVLWTLRHTLSQWLRHGGATEGEAYDIVMAVSEAATNVIEHAYGPERAAFSVDVHNDAGEISVVVRDKGRWRPARGTDRGRGLTMMRALMESVEVRRGDHGTEVHLLRRLGRRT